MSIWPRPTPSAFEAMRRYREKRESYKANAEFYTSDAWLRIRYAALRRFDGCCHCCGCRPIRTPLHIDHIRPRSKYPALALDPDNVQVLCQDCNYGKSNRDETDWRWK